jgi:hypothetical protein
MSNWLQGIEPRGLAAIPTVQRDPGLEREVEAAGFARLGVTWAQPPEEDSGPAQDPGAQIRTLQLLRFGPPRLYCQLFQAPDRRAWVSIERTEGNTWLCMISLREDGTTVRTLVQPFPTTQQLDAEWAEMIDGPPLVPGFADLMRDAVGEHFPTAFPDRPGVGMRQRVLPVGTSFAELRKAHAAHVTATGTGAPLTDHPLELYLPAERRMNHVHQDHLARARARGVKNGLIVLAVTALTRLVLFWALWQPSPAFWQAWLLAEIGMRAAWAGLLRKRPGPVPAIAVLVLLGTMTWSPINAGVLAMVLVLGVLQRFVTTPSIAGSQGGAVAARWSAAWTEPAPVPAARLSDAYPIAEPAHPTATNSRP